MIRKTAIARSVALAFGMAAVGGWVAPAAYAQSNTTGTIYGSVSSPAGIEVVAENTATGVKRSVKPDASGRYSFASLPVGTYTVTMLRNGSTVEKRENVDVLISQGTEISFSSTAVVQIVGSRIRRLDLSSAGSTTTFTSKDLERVPVASNVGAIIQLAPNTTRGDSRYGGSNAPSFGGSSASENAYYINGFPVTTLLTQVGFSQLPFNAIGQAQVLTGGYGAEFGRSTGGVVNMITKRGGNEFEVGGAISLEPRALRAKEKDQFYAANGQPVSPATGQSIDGKYFFYNGLNDQDRTVLSAYASGPIIKDKLFFFAAVEDTRTNRDTIRTANTSTNYTASAASQSTAFQEITTKIPRYLIKLDFALTDNHSFEYTRISDDVKQDRKFFGFNYATLQRTDVQRGGQSYRNWGPTPVAAQQGATVDILKYTGYLTNDLTVTLLGGKTRTEHEQTPDGYNPAIPQVSAPAAARAPGLTYVEGAQTITGNLLVPGAYDENKGIRLDVEWRLSTQHTLRAGVDRNTIKSLSGASQAGGSLLTYGITDPNVPLTASVPTSSVAGNPLAALGYYVNRTITSTGAKPSVDQQAWYVEDKWQVNKDLLLVLGLRNEGFNNKNGDGVSYIKLSRQLAPRVSATWDPVGDQQTKVFGSFGRYHVPLPTNVAIRGAGASLFTQQNFVYTGVDANGLPTGLTQISGLYSSNNEFGQSKDPRTVAAQNMKGNYQDELALGIERALVPGLTGGVKFTYRTLKTALDDHCDNRPFLAWASRNNVDVSNWSGFISPDGEQAHGYSCALFNPGLGNTFTLNLSDNTNANAPLTTIKLSAADLGIVKPKRTYMALDFFIEKQFDGKWAGKLTYTYSKNKGNAEGQLNSDIGQGDVATTVLYDYPEFSVNANGLLPNNRTHKLKAFGYFQATQEIGVGGALVLSSGRPKSCLGNPPAQVALQPNGDYDTTPYVPGVSPVADYGGYASNAYFFCNGQAVTRGSAGTLPVEFALDLNAVYAPSWAPGLKFKLDVFNALNRQVAEVVEERYNNNGGATSIRSTYDAVLSYSAPRSAKITVSYDKKF